VVTGVQLSGRFTEAITFC